MMNQRNQVGTFLDSLKNAERESGVYEAIRKDLERAQDVQKSFLPPGNLSIPCLGSETFYLPARGLGGDYYDFIPLEGGRWGIAIGDVSGKGISAALMMASLRASLRAQALHPHSDLPTRENVKLSRRVLTIPRSKSEETRHLPINSAAMKALSELGNRGDSSGRVIRNAKAEPLNDPPRHWFLKRTSLGCGHNSRHGWKSERPEVDFVFDPPSHNNHNFYVTFSAQYVHTNVLPVSNHSQIYPRVSDLEVHNSLPHSGTEEAIESVNTSAFVSTDPQS